MPLFEREDKFRCYAETERYRIDVNYPEKGLMRFILKNDSGETELEAVTGALSFGEAQESAGLYEKTRAHLAENGISASAETQAVIPFGTEPEVRKNYILRENSLEIQTFMNMRQAMQMTSVNAGTIKVSGKIRRAGIVPYPKKNSVVLPAAEWKEHGCIYESEMIPLAVVIETESGTLVEINSGADTWRWMRAAAAGGKSAYRVDYSDDGIVFTRVLHEWTAQDKDDVTPSGRPWQTSMNIFWDFPAKAKRGRKKAYKSVFDLKKMSSGANCKAAAADGKTAGAACLLSAGTVSAMKTWVRQVLPDVKKNDVLAVTGYEPVLCWNSSHLNRAKKGVLPHGGRAAVISFQEWANKQLARKGASLVIE